MNEQRKRSLLKAIFSLLIKRGTIKGQVNNLPVHCAFLSNDGDLRSIILSIGDYSCTLARINKLTLSTIHDLTFLKYAHLTLIRVIHQQS